MTERETILTEARRIAGQPTGDRLEGKQGADAHSVMLRLLEETGLDYVDALKLMGAYEWDRWNAGFTAGRERRIETEGN